jgi:hypothetical protein
MAWRRVMGSSRLALLALGAVAALAGATTAHAAGPKLRLISNGKPVPKGQRTQVVDLVSFPGFTCEGFNGGMIFEGSGGTTLRFNYGGGGAEAFESCKTPKGEKVSTATECECSKLSSVAITSATITEHYPPRQVIFEDSETGCVWELQQLQGTTPSSGPLEKVGVSGTVKLRTKISAHTCPKTGEASGTVTIEAAPEAPPGSYEVERLP